MYRSSKRLFRRDKAVCWKQVQAEAEDQNQDVAEPEIRHRNGYYGSGCGEHILQSPLSAGCNRTRNEREQHCQDQRVTTDEQRVRKAVANKLCGGEAASQRN